MISSPGSKQHTALLNQTCDRITNKSFIAQLEYHYVPVANAHIAWLLKRSKFKIEDHRHFGCRMDMHSRRVHK